MIARFARHRRPCDLGAKLKDALADASPYLDVVGRRRQRLWIRETSAIYIVSPIGFSSFVRSFVSSIVQSSLELENHRPPIANDYLEADIVQALRLNPTCLRHRDYEAIGYAKNLFVREASPIS